MGRNRQPAIHPDIPVEAVDVPLSFEVNVQLNGVPLDGRFYEWSAPVIDDGKIIGHLDIEYADVEIGTFGLTLSSDLWNQLKSYSTWQLRERSVLKGAIIQGRFVKATTT